MSSHKLPAESICFSVLNPNFCLRPRFCEVLASRSRNLRQLGKSIIKCCPIFWQKTKTVHFHLPFTRLCSCSCFQFFPVCRHLPICMALESVVGQIKKKNAMDPDPTTTHSRTFPKFHSHHRCTIPAGRHCGLGPGCARWFISSCKTPIMVSDGRILWVLMIFVRACWIYLELVSMVDR